MPLDIQQQDFEAAEKFRRGHGGRYDREVAMLVAAFARHRASEAERVREACAKVAEEFRCPPDLPWRDVVATRNRIAAAIRSLPIGGE